MKTMKCKIKKTELQEVLGAMWKAHEKHNNEAYCYLWWLNKSNDKISDKFSRAQLITRMKELERRGCIEKRTKKKYSPHLYISYSLKKKVL